MRRAAGLLLRLGAVSSLVVCLGASSATAQWFGSRRARVTEASIRGHMEMLASDAMNGRGSGTRDEWLAAVYIGAQLRRWGLVPLGNDGGFVQTIETPQRAVVGAPVLRLAGTSFVHGVDLQVDIVGPPHVTGPLTRFARGVVIPAGAVALVTGPDTPTADLSSNAAAVLVMRPPASPVQDVVSPRVRDARTPWRVALAPQAFAAISRLPDGEVVTLDAELRATRTWNAIGKIDGRDPSRRRDAILLTAHLDHIGVRGTGDDRINNGADDDASGSTAVLEFARVLASGPAPERTIIFAWFGSEEVGGFGARYFLEHPPVPLTSIVANLEFEMIGRPDPLVPPRTSWLAGYERTTLGPALAAHGARLVADPHPDQRFFQRSDNIELARRGVVAQGLSTYGLHAQYHTPQDDLAHIDFPHLTAIIESLVDPIRWLANSSFIPTWRPGGQPDPIK